MARGPAGHLLLPRHIVTAASNDQAITPTGVTVTVTPGTPAISRTVSPVGATVAVTAGTLSLDDSQQVTPTGPTVTVTPGTPTLSRSITLTGPTVTVTPGTVTIVNHRFPTSVDATNKRILDQNGDPWYGIGDSAWSIIAQETPAKHVEYLDYCAAVGINLVMLSIPEAYYTDNTPAYRNAQGDDPFTGTVFRSSLNSAYWSVADDFIEYAGTLGITCLICPMYIGSSDTDGWFDELESAYSAASSNITTYAATVAARYASYPNIMWLIGHDRGPSATMETIAELIAGELTSGTSHLILPGGYADELGSVAWSTTSIVFDADTVYEYTATAGTTLAAARTSGTVGFLEGRYEQEEPFGFTTGIGVQRLREQYWGPFCAGAAYVIFGNNPRWHFESGKEFYSYSGTWEESFTNALYNDGTVHLGYHADFIAAVDCLDTLPDTTGTFLTSGTGFARFDTTIGVAYQTAAASITLDTTELAGTGNVRIRRYDPTDGSFTTVATSEAQNSSRSISHAGTNAGGGNDWVYVVDLTSDQSVAPTGPTVTITPGTPTLSRSIALTGPTVTVTPGTPTLSRSIALTGPTVTVTPGTASVLQGLPIAPDGASVTVTPGTPTFSMTVSLTGATVTVTPGTASVFPAQAVTPAGPTVTITPGTPALALAVTPTGASVTVTAGSVTFSGDQAITVTEASVTVTAGTLVIVNGEVPVIYGPALTYNPPPILTHRPPSIITGRSA